MRRWTRKNELFTAENNGGIEPATPGPLLYSALTNGQPEEREAPVRTNFSAALIEVTEDGLAPIDIGPMDDGGAAAIEEIFRCKIAGLRNLPRRERPNALRVARDWRLLAMADVREKRMYERHARYMQARQQRPSPG